ncbi:MAG: SDR family NAD(P)-dependent oxidoreductase [Verrucomicrobiota bacterium]|nr:SDR family NAD(P)-dependent oxidoreductase [Verrucomicrobiota bacterium]
MKQLCVVVGFGAGNGLAIAKAFSREGHELALIARSRAKKENALAELEAAGATAQLFEADAADPKSLAAAFAEIRRDCGDPTLLIYNAFAMRMASPSATKPEDLVADFKSNVAGALGAVQQVLPAMKAAQSGTIIFTGGAFALDPMPRFASVGVGKAALRNLAFSLAKELGPQGIHVGTVTIHGMVKEGTHFAPEKIAESFLELYRQPKESFTTEVDYR